MFVLYSPAAVAFFMPSFFLVQLPNATAPIPQEERWRRCAGLSLQLGSRDDAGNNLQPRMRHGRFWRRSGDFLFRLTQNGTDSACSREPGQERRWGGDINTVEGLNFGCGRIRGQQYPWSQDSVWHYDSKPEYWYDIFIFLSRLLKQRNMPQLYSKGILQQLLRCTCTLYRSISQLFEGSDQLRMLINTVFVSINKISFVEIKRLRKLL